jgi:hypothetical protein
MPTSSILNKSTIKSTVAMLAVSLQASPHGKTHMPLFDGSFGSHKLGVDIV